MTVTELTDTCHRVDCHRIYLSPIWFVTDLTGTGYISYSAKYRKMAHFDPSGSRNHLTDFDKTWHG